MNLEIVLHKIFFYKQCEGSYLNVTSFKMEFENLICPALDLRGLEPG